VRLSLHPTMTDAELHYIIRAIKDIGQNHRQYARDYEADLQHGSFRHRLEPEMDTVVQEWLALEEEVAVA
jgi:hypothetical protein